MSHLDAVNRMIYGGTNGGSYGGTAMPNLTNRKVETVKLPGMYGDGEGLYLRVGPSGGKSWIVRTLIKGRYTKSGKPLRWEGGLGSAKLVSLAEAREKARALRKIARDGGDPVTTHSKETLTFEAAARRVHQNLLPTWRNKKHAETWLATIENYALPVFGNRVIEDVGTADILAVLSPIWVEKHETAKRLKQRLATVFDWAKGAGHYPHENPVNGLKKALPPVKHRPKHMPALPWRDVPEFMSSLSQREGMSARTLEFLILTACRSGEVRGARWEEIDSDVWTLPGQRTKVGLPHRVPLSDPAKNVLELVRGQDAEFVFPSHVRGKFGEAREQSVMVFKGLMKRMSVEGITIHGFRSTFRDWCSECARADREVAEAALAHATGNEVERAYARSDLFERRVVLMDAWGRFCAGETGQVVKMVR